MKLLIALLLCFSFLSVQANEEIKKAEQRYELSKKETAKYRKIYRDLVTRKNRGGGVSFEQVDAANDRYSHATSEELYLKGILGQLRAEEKSRNR